MRPAMSHAALTVKYRPQTFAQVAGQETIKAILSRASLEQRVAAAYLFSGTRGVGKTTLARIFAKALNCRNAPTAEPCNNCDQCRAVTQGSAVDVVEIDGASNRGIDDVRRLKEVVGYAPMEGGYKIFIIDEAHMLSREAFNALLKTLEEPPARVTFVMATTEPHKFPATIISRCQHFVFKRLPESGLIRHLENVLAQEKMPFDSGAVRLIARRGAGSVRDSMSLLSQVLALGEGKLTEDSARSILGLAGQEAFFEMLEAFKTGDSLTLSRLLGTMLDQGLDMGFFLRELSSLWRNMFMLRQSGEAALAVVELPENEARACLEAARGFSLQHIHACWQMTLEGQRRVLTSLEPALALELLLLNLAMLPQLLALEQLSTLGRKAAPQGGAPAGGSPSGGTPPPGNFSPSPAPAALATGGGARFSSPSDAERHSKEASPAAEPEPEPAHPAPVEESAAAPSAVEPQAVQDTDPLPVAAPSAPESRSDSPPSFDIGESDTLDEPDFQDDDYNEAAIQVALQELSGLEEELSRAPDPVVDPPVVESVPVESKEEWEAVTAVLAEMEVQPWLAALFNRVGGAWDGDVFVLAAHDEFAVERFQDSEAVRCLEEALARAFGKLPEYRFSVAARQRKTRDEIRQIVLDHPLVKELQDGFGASLLDYGQMR